ncbi:uncharacterized protein LOC111681792 [Lucilia cuprina]|uniref:uncharacterized protein LOC111681792 n=1 Tax=Lucilia cuprina TaxID=7375 RepID=UPI001F06BF69|nr:uncharacterized protein LOC111681792 [Lucilia cuprina]
MLAAGISSVVLPIFLDEIFQRFSNCSPQDQEAIENLLLDLHKLLGNRLVPSALHILDNCNNIIYIANETKTLELAEISEGGPSFRLVRLFRHLNYCSCEYFQEKVLNKQIPYSGSYTCQHVLALRLAFTLQHKCLQFKKVPNQKLDLLLKYFLPDYTAAD